MIIENKYSKWYMQIISKAREDVNNRTEGYFEKHHIIPRSCGGTEENENLIKLTAREHFICHILLIKCLSGKFKHKMAKAAHCMMYLKNKNIQREFKINSKIYSLLRKAHAKAISEQMLGKTKTKDHAKAISEALKGRKFSDEHRQNLSKVMLERIEAGWDNPWSGEKGSIMSSVKNKERVLNGANPWAGEKGSELSRQICAKQLANGTHPFQGKQGRLMAQQRNAKIIAEGKHINQLDHTCPHCGKTGKGRTMFRWHFKNCKHL